MRMKNEKSDSQMEFQNKMSTVIASISQMMWRDLAQNIDRNIHKRDDARLYRTKNNAEWSEADLV